MTALPLAIYWGLALWGLFSRRPVLIWLFFAMLPFGSLAVIPPAASGGLSLIAANMTVALIIVRQFVLTPNGLPSLTRIALPPGRGGVLLAYWIVATVVTLFAPRLFSGQIEVTPMAITGFMQTAALRPSLQNISQLAYVTVSVFAVFAFARAFQHPAMRSVLVRGLMLAATLTLATGALDLASTYVPIDPLMAPFRTASYRMLDNELLADGAKRVTGLMPEASSYGALVLMLMSLLYFLRRSVVDPGRRAAITLLLLGLGLFLVLSTSSAGYVGIAVFLVVIVLEWLVRILGIERSALARRGTIPEFTIAAAGLGLLALAATLSPALFSPVFERLDTMVFGKTQSLSYLERSMWTRTAYEAGLSSHLLGVGLGSVRASNFAAAIFGSTGLLGFVLFFGFVVQSLLRKAPDSDPQAQAMTSALKWSFAPVFAVSLLIGTTPDFGEREALRWGLLLALTLSPPLLHATARRRVGPSGAGGTAG
jgi:hypothetical protein